MVVPSEADRLRELWERKICPNCGAPIPEGKGYGSGQIDRGLFCTLKCYGEFHKADLLERARLLERASERN